MNVFLERSPQNVLVVVIWFPKKNMTWQYSNIDVRVSLLFIQNSFSCPFCIIYAHDELKEIFLPAKRATLVCLASNGHLAKPLISSPSYSKVFNWRRNTDCLVLSFQGQDSGGERETALHTPSFTLMISVRPNLILHKV